MHALEMCGPRKSASPCGPHGSAWGLLQISPAARDGPANQMTLCSIKTALSTVHRSLSSTLPSTVLHEPSAVWPGSCSDGHTGLLTLLQTRINNERTCAITFSPHQLQICGMGTAFSPQGAGAHMTD